MTRLALPTAILIALVALGFAVASARQANELQTKVAELQRDLGDMPATVARLSTSTASGGGVNVKLMPDPKTGEATVPLEEVFTFDRNHAICRVDTNPQAFKMKTFKMGEVAIDANRFFMAMVANTITAYRTETLPDGKRKVTMTGSLDCSTYVGLATITIGSRTATEPASFKIEAVDGGPGGGRAGDSFAFTVFFDEKGAPINYAIFGPEFTFTGRMVSGEITIVDVNARP